MWHEHDRSPCSNSLSLRSELERRLNARVITFTDEGNERPGGMCRCCGGGPVVEPTWRAEPWYVYRAGICDSDGVYYSMLCEGCLEEIRALNTARPLTERDTLAKEITDLLGDDIDGAGCHALACVVMPRDGLGGVA